MHKDSHLIFEAYSNKLVSEDMPYPTFAKLSKHAASKLPSKESLEDWETRMKKFGCDITKDNKTGTYHAWHGKEHTSSYRTQGENEEKSAHEFKQQMPDSKEEYSAHDYAKEMEMRGEAEEEPKHPLGNVREVPARDLKPGDVLSLFKNTVIKIDDMAPRLIKGKVRVTYKDIRGVVHNVDWNKSTKITVDNVSQEDGEEGDLMKHMKDKGMIDAKATDDTGKYGRSREEEEHCADEDEQRRLDPKCWKGYHKSGTKLKSGVRVNNCVKN